MEPENEEQFWTELEETLSKPCDTHSLIDDALRSYLTLTTSYPIYIRSEDEIQRCAFELYSSPLFAQHADYIRRQFVHCLLQEEEVTILHIAATLILADAREHEDTFSLLNEESTFPRLITMISEMRGDGKEDLHRQLMELLYEMARIQKITNDDLTCIDDDFVCAMFDIIEQVSGDVDDPYHYPVIRVLLVLNEQFMVAAHDPTTISHGTTPLTNKVLKVLSVQGSRYKTFGENIILLLNRADETSLQLLTLKLLYLLFTTPPTYEYFYTNDLHVLVDILIRNLLDLPENASALRHTYLRVLYPLLEHTQLKHAPHYKRTEIRKLLAVLIGGQLAQFDNNSPTVTHFEEVDETTKRLVQRCQTVTWLRDDESETLVDSISEQISPTSSSPSKTKPPALPAPRKLRKRTGSKSSGSGSEFLMPVLDSARQSSLSVAEMATQKEKPGVITPSRNLSVKQGLRVAILQKKEKPPPPKARRSGLGRLRAVSKPDSETESSRSPNALSTGEQENDVQKEPELEASNVMADTKQPKKPPPAPKTRRWRGKKSKENNDDTAKSEEGEYAEAEELPFNPSDSGRSVEQSPLSPLARSLLPSSAIHDSFSARKAKRISSVSAALGEAQAQALQDLEKTLDQASIHDSTGPDKTGDFIGNQQAVLAPPGQAPSRGVPGPTLELENNMSKERGESEQEQQQYRPKSTLSKEDMIEEESEDEWN